MRTVIKKEKGFIGPFLLIALIVVLAAGIFYWTKSGEQKPLIKPQTRTQPTPTPNPWKTYTNSKYNFTLTYPKMGVIHGEKEYFEGECGKAIKEEENEAGNLILFDNLVEIKILPWEGSVNDYLKSQGADYFYDIAPIASSSATEALELTGMKKGAEIAVGYPPLVYVKYIYKQGSNLFIVRNPPTHVNPGGCVNPDLIDPVKFAKFQDQGWDFKHNFKFSQ